uniref:hypothetical protein n=1 Tax=Bacillus multifaciens TaxID=3068506 RepID=UPI003F492A7F
MEVIKEVINEELYIDELTGKKDPDQVKVKVVTDSDGQINTYEKNFSVHTWEYFKEQGIISF